ncbi:MAG: adenylyl-sulfate kinase [Phycisphaerae bacterium]
MTNIKATNITWHEGHVGRDEREKLLRQKGALLWFTGLSGSGKSTIAYTVEHALMQRGHLAYVLDGDNIRHGLNKNLGFSAEDRQENIRRIAEVGKLFVDVGAVTLTAFISPYRADREAARETVGADSFFEIFCDTPLAVCEQRDPKGLYKKARAGEIKGFTGIDDPYEAPEHAELVIDTSKVSPQDAAVQICTMLERAGKINALEA